MRHFLMWYTLSAGANSCIIQNNVRITITVRVGINNQKYGFWGAVHIVLQEFE